VLCQSAGHETHWGRSPKRSVEQMQFELNCGIMILKVMIKEDCDNGLCAWKTYRCPLPSNVFKMDLCAYLTVRGACY